MFPLIVCLTFSTLYCLLTEKYFVSFWPEDFMDLWNVLVWVKILKILVEWRQVRSLKAISVYWTAVDKLSVVLLYFVAFCVAAVCLSSLVFQYHGSTTSLPMVWTGFGLIRRRGLNSARGHMKSSILRRLPIYSFVCTLMIISCSWKQALWNLSTTVTRLSYCFRGKLLHSF